MSQISRTQAVHAGRADLAKLGVHAPPIDLSSTYPLDDLDNAICSLDAAVAGEIPAANPIYARLHNPTVARCENAIAELELCESAVAFGSGMAAITACLLDARQRGSHVIALHPVYGTTEHLLQSGLAGLEVTWCDAADVHDALRPDTALVLMETPANPTLALVDIEAVVAAAGDVPVLVDSTFATPVLQQPITCGASYVVHSATKFLGGHGDVIAGIVATSEARARGLRKVRVATGALLHPLAAYLLHRGLPTLPLRVESAQASATKLARRLQRHGAVGAVHFPGLHGQDPLGLIGRQMTGPGTLIAFEVENRDAARSVMSAIRLITPAVSLGSVDSLLQHPAGLTHRVLSEAARLRSGIGEGLLRLSVGLEEPEDLWHDLAQALDAISEPKRLNIAV